MAQVVVAMVQNAPQNLNDEASGLL